MCAFAGAFVAPANAADFPDPASEESARRGAEYIAGQQEENGGIPSLGGGVSVSGTAEAVVALLAGGRQPESVEQALGYIADRAEAFVDDSDTQGGHIGPVIWALVAAGEQPRDFAGIDWIAELEERYIPATGTYGGNLYGDSLAMLGWLAAGEELPFAAENRLRLNQCGEGGWSWSVGCGGAPDTDTTSLALSVLAAAAGPSDEDVQQARQWLLDTQNPSGCWSVMGGNDQANSCGLAVSAIVALAEDPGASPWASGERDPVKTLRDDFQLDNGGFSRSAGDTSADNYATVQVVPGMAYWSHPVSAPESESDPDPTPEGDDEEADSGDDRGEGRTTTSTETRRQGSGDNETREDDESRDRRPPRVDASPYSTTTRAVPKPTTTTGAGVTGEGASGGTPATRQPPPGVASASYGGDGGGVGMVPTGVAVGSLGSVGLAAGWYWRRRAVAAGLVPWSQG